MESFLQHTACSILTHFDWNELRHVTLVLPSHRAGMVLTQEILRLQQERQAPVIWAPTVMTLTQLQDALSPLYAEDELFTIVRLYKLYRALAVSDERLAVSGEPMPLDVFYNWGRQMLADFTNIDASMDAEEVPNFFANTIAAHELSEWHLDAETEARLRSLVGVQTGTALSRSVRGQYEVLWQQLYTLYRTLHEQMQGEQKGYTGMRQRAVLEQWDSPSVQEQLQGRTFVFVGFNYLLPVERDLMLRLKKARQAMFYWDFVSDFPTNEKAFSFAKRNSELLGSEGVKDEGVKDERVKVTLISCSSREAQAQYVHRWLQENYTKKGERVGIVICDETMLEPVIYTLPAITLEGEDGPSPVNITKGFPLRHTAVYAQVLSWLNDRQRGDAEQVVSPAFIDELEAFLFPIREDEPESIAIRQNPLEWQELLILESEYQVRKIVNQMRLLLTNGIDGVSITLKLLRLLMRRMMEGVTMPFHGEPVTDIQVMGVLETRLLDFDRLLLLNVEEGVIPQQQTDSSFIPYYLRKAYHMQTSDERATVYAYNFFRLLSRAGQTTILYASADSTEGGKGMSRFVMQMLYSPQFEIDRQELHESSVLQVPDYQQPASESICMKDTLEVVDGILRRKEGKRYQVSPSAINTYITCPRSFYLQYILGLQPAEEEDVLFAPNTLGSFVHHAMEYLYRTYLHCDNESWVRVTPEQIEVLRTDEAKIQLALEDAYRAMNELWLERHPQEPEHYIAAHHAGENVVIKGYVNNVLERDREDAKVGLQLYMLEQSRSFSVQIDGVGELLVGGVVDRLDVYGAPGHERLRIVDYKSGAYNDSTHEKKMSASKEEIMTSDEKNYVRQTLIYCHAVMQHDKHRLPIEPHLYFCRRKLTDITTTLEVDGAPVNDYRAISSMFYEELAAKIKQMLTTTSFPQCEPDQCPSYCPFFALCGRKKNEW